MTFENIIAFIKKHKAMLGLGAIGLEIAFLMLVIGFFRTLFLVVLTLLFGVYGYFIDKLGFRGANKACEPVQAQTMNLPQVDFADYGFSKQNKLFSKNV